MRFLILFSLIILSGCSYPHYQLQKLDDTTFENKRGDKKTLNIQEFIRPEETQESLKKMQRRDFSPDAEKNTVLNILYYIQHIKNTNDKRDFWQYPSETIQKGGDCEDKTFLLLSMLIQAGVSDVGGVKGRYLGQGHMWVEYGSPSNRCAPTGRHPERALIPAPLYGAGVFSRRDKEYILDPSMKSAKLIPIEKSIGYAPFFKFDENNIYYCNTTKGD